MACIMFVDSDVSYTRYLKAVVLAHEPEWDVIEAHSQSEALSLQGERSIDAIAMNRNFSEMDPAQLLQQLHDLQPQAKMAMMAKPPQLEELELPAIELAWIAKPMTEQKLMGFLYGHC